VFRRSGIGQSEIVRCLAFFREAGALRSGKEGNDRRRKDAEQTARKRYTAAARLLRGRRGAVSFATPVGPLPTALRCVMILHSQKFLPIIFWEALNNAAVQRRFTRLASIFEKLSVFLSKFQHISPFMLFSSNC
jgi:hypothetical protein